MQLHERESEKGGGSPRGSPGLLAGVLLRLGAVLPVMPAAAGSSSVEASNCTAHMQGKAIALASRATHRCRVRRGCLCGERRLDEERVRERDRDLLYDRRRLSLHGQHEGEWDHEKQAQATGARRVPRVGGRAPLPLKCSPMAMPPSAATSPPAATSAAAPAPAAPHGCEAPARSVQRLLQRR